MVNIPTHLAANISENIIIIRKMVKELKLGKMALSTLENGKIISNMEKVCSQIKKAIPRKVIGITVKEKKRLKKNKKRNKVQNIQDNQNLNNLVNNQKKDQINNNLNT